MRARNAARFPALAWTRGSGGEWRATGRDEDQAPREVSVPSEQREVLHVAAYAGPRELRALMDAIQANYCHAAAAMAPRDVNCGDDWHLPEA
ncbi:hypothetical protein [Fulvimonas yonginensis]|uniref:Uncharacterized protein n=1 Tax=Fulvimonas yonginensis TaxID=1495200 RepID=A0ABU8JDE7_9GAMM